MPANALNLDTIVQQVVYSTTSTYTTISSTIPYDTSIPQITEGTEFLTASISPKFSDSTLEIEFFAPLKLDDPLEEYIAALFQDSTADALCSISINGSWDFSTSTEGAGLMLIFRHLMTSGTTSSTTFKVRLGCNDGSSLYLNGDDSGSLYGGICQSYLKITEIKQW